MPASTPAPSPTFCILPWLHLCVWLEGNIYPCGLARSEALGNVGDVALSDVWNAPALRRMRLDMLAGRHNPACEMCYERERVDFLSKRQEVNDKFSAYLPLIERTGADGSLQTFDLRYLGVSFSNLCNHRCRICRSARSSAWARPGEGPAIIAAERRPGDLVRRVEPWLEQTEEIKFDGGEPLLEEGHYRLLETLIRRGLTHVRLDYATNFSTLSLRGWDAPSLWNRFASVEVGASLDGMGRRAEYMRSGQEWSRVLAHRERMSKDCPRARFFIRATLSVLNALHFPDFHLDWLSRGYVGADGLVLRTLSLPPEYNVQALPLSIKRRVAERYRRHSEDLVSRLGSAGRRAADDFQAAVAFMMDRDLSDHLPRFRQVTAALDAERGESLAEAFPELAPLLRDG